MALLVRKRAFFLLLLLLLATAPLVAESERSNCVSIQRVTAFAPRGEIYVDVKPSCAAEDFEHEDPILVYLEVIVSDLPAVGQDVRVYSHAPGKRETLHFQDLSFAPGDPVLVRLVRFGEILDLQTIKAP